MLTRLKVKGFKNLVDVDVRFGPFTCIAGANGVGKSNLFDAIRFLSALADRPLIDAARAVRDESGQLSDIRSIFHQVGAQFAPELSFEAEMIVPESGVDDLGQQAAASITFLRYGVTIGYRGDDDLGSQGALELLREELVHIKIGEARKHLPFPHSKGWRDSAVHGRRSGSFFISTDESGETRVIRRHQEGTQGRTLPRAAASLPRTVLSVANATESPTTLLARREMQSWQLLQLEPSSLRRPDEFSSSARLGTDGSHLAATLNRLARMKNGHAGDVYAQLANRLSQLIDDVKTVSVDRDEKRELLTALVTDRTGTAYPARALSDGTLRFLALAVLELDPETAGVLCFEEPENGIHPERIPAILQLLQEIATDPHEPLGLDNPLRQVIINTHSPAVVNQIPDDTLLVATLEEMVRQGQFFKQVRFKPLADTWRSHTDETIVPIARGDLLAYLNPTGARESDLLGATASQHVTRTRRVMDRPDLQPLLPLFAVQE